MSPSPRSSITCPICNAELNSDELHALHQGSAEALDRLRAEHKSELQAREREAAARLKESDDRRKADIKQLQDDRVESLKELKKQHQESLAELKQVMAEGQKEQLAQVETGHKRNLEQLQRDLRESHEREKTWEEERARIRKEGEDAQTRLMLDAAEREKRLADAAKQAASEELAKKDQTIQELRTTSDRLTHQIEELRQMAQRSPSDVIGDAGEFLLKETLESAFPGDEIRKISQPGQKSGDVRQRVLVSPGKFTPTVLIFDNKVGKKVTAKDLASARGYREVHQTDYVLIVTDVMPGENTDKLLLDDQGVLVVKRAALLCVVEVLRRQLVKLDQARASGKNREGKESQVFEYVRGDEFQRNLRRLLAIDLKEMELLQTEKRSHENMWKQREKLRVERDEAVGQIETSTSAILEQEALEPGTDSALHDGTAATPTIRRRRLPTVSPSES